MRYWPLYLSVILEPDLFICEWVRHRTRHNVELAPLQNDGKHEDELRGALWKRLDEPQHAEVVAQVHGEILVGILEPPEEAA